MRLINFGILGKIGGSKKSSNQVVPIVEKAISVAPKHIFLNLANNNYAEVDVKTEVSWNVV